MVLLGRLQRDDDREDGNCIVIVRQNRVMNMLKKHCANCHGDTSVNNVFYGQS